MLTLEYLINMKAAAIILPVGKFPKLINELDVIRLFRLDIFQNLFGMSSKNDNLCSMFIR